MRLIYLVRDGRGVSLSKKEHMHLPFWKAVLSWLRYTIKCQALKLTIPASQKLTVRYESLCLDTESEIRRICSFIGVPFDPAAARLDMKNKHNISSSLMRFIKPAPSICLDSRWESELTTADKRLFFLLGGFVNRALGYRRSSPQVLRAD